MLKAICFDMDGTIADLYHFPDWLARLRKFDPSPYRNCEPMWDMEALALLLMELQKKKVEIHIVTWLSKETTPAYDRQVTQAKIDWLRHYDFPCDAFHGVAYGTNKADVMRKALGGDYTAILVDDNEKVRSKWDMGATIDPTACDNLVEVLKGLL